MAERWEQDKLGVKPRHTWDEAAAKFLEETRTWSHCSGRTGCCTHASRGLVARPL